MECAYYFALLNGIGGKRWNRRAGETEGGGADQAFGGTAFLNSRQKNLEERS